MEGNREGVKVENTFNVPEKAIAVGDRMAEETIQHMLWYSTPIGPGKDDVLSKKLGDDSASTFIVLLDLYRRYDQREAADRLEQMLKDA